MEGSDTWRCSHSTIEPATGEIMEGHRPQHYTRLLIPLILKSLFSHHLCRNLYRRRCWNVEVDLVAMDAVVHWRKRMISLVQPISLGVVRNESQVGFKQGNVATPQQETLHVRVHDLLNLLVFQAIYLIFPSCCESNFNLQPRLSLNPGSTLVLRDRDGSGIAYQFLMEAGCLDKPWYARQDLHDRYIHLGVSRNHHAYSYTFSNVAILVFDIQGSCPTGPANINSKR